MNNYTAPEFVLQILRSQGFKYFKVFGSDGKSLLVHQADESFTVEQAAEYLERTFENCTGTLHVNLYPRAKMGGGGDSRTVKYVVDTRDMQTVEDTPASSGMVGIGAIEEKFNARLEALEQKYIYEGKIKDLERKLEDATNGTNPMLEKVLSGLLPLLGSGQPRPVAGTSGENDGAVDPERVRISRAVQRIMAVDPEFATNLEALADLAENNTTMYNMAITQLKSM